MSGLFIFGFGYSAPAVAERMRTKVDKVWGTTRDRQKLTEIGALGLSPILFDSSSFSAASETLSGALSTADLVLVCIGPDSAGDPILRHFRDTLERATPKSLVYLSTVGVYGDHDGAWVDETSICRPVSRRSTQRLVAEEAWERFAEDTGIPVAIVRLAGIYGPGRGPFEKIRRGTARRIIKPGQIFNRIHVDDIAAIVEAAFKARADGIFNGSDDAPAPPEDVLAYAAELLGLPAPPEIPFEEAELTPMARSFYGESKRVRNDKIKRELGVQLAFPTYRDGLTAIAAAEGLR